MARSSIIRGAAAGALVLAVAAVSTPSSGAPDTTAPLACEDAVITDGADAKPVLWGVVRPSDPVSLGHLHPYGEPGDTYPYPACGVPNRVPPVTEPSRVFHHVAYTFENRTGAPACITTELIFYACGSREPCPPEVGACANLPDCDSGVGLHEVAVYANAFDPTDLRKNFLADAGRFDGGPGIERTLFSVPAGGRFVVVVRAPEFDQRGYDPYFDLYVKGCGRAATDAGTGTGTPPTTEAPDASTPPVTLPPEAPVPETPGTPTPVTPTPEEAPGIPREPPAPDGGTRAGAGENPVAPYAPPEDTTRPPSGGSSGVVVLGPPPADDPDSGGCDVSGHRPPSLGLVAIGILLGAGAALARRRRPHDSEV